MKKGKFLIDDIHILNNKLEAKKNIKSYLIDKQTTNIENNDTNKQMASIMQRYYHIQGNR